jgi:outer membrane protein, heavy metal efflux system
MTSILYLIFSIFFINQTYALNEKDIIESVNNNFLLIEKEILETQAVRSKIQQAQGGFDTKLSFKNRLWQESDYDNQFHDIGIEKLTPFYGISVKGGQRKGQGNFPVYEGKYKTSDVGEIYLGLNMPLLRNLTTDNARTEMAKSNFRLGAAEENLSLKKNYYSYKALLIFFQYQLENQKAKITQEIYKLAQQRQLWLENKIRAGDVEEIRLVDNNRSLLKRENDLLKIEMNLLKNRNKLKLFLRDKHGKPVEVPDTIMPNEDLLLSVFSKIPEINFNKIPAIRMLQREIDLLQADYNLEQQNQLPDLGLDLLAMRNLADDKMLASKDSLQIGINFTFPLENNKASGKTQELFYKVQAYKKQLEYLKQELSTQYNYTLKSLELSQQSWKILSKESVAARKMAETEQRKFRQGASDLFIVNIREQDFADTEVRKWKTYIDSIKYYLDLSLITGSVVF